MTFMKKIINSVLLNILLVLIVVLTIVPFIYMALTSLRHTYALDFSFSLRTMDFKNYVTIFKNYSFFTYLFNSIIVVGGAVIFNIIFSSLAGYSFAKKKFPGKEFIFWIFLATMMIPAQVTLIPMFLIMKKVHLLNTSLALILPLLDAFGVFLCRQFMSEGLPDELIEAAKIDGCKEMSIFINIVIPLAKPVLIALAIFTFITSWNDFIRPLIFITDETKQTLTLALSTLQGNFGTNYGLVMAGATMTFLPPFLFYAFMQKQFVEGIALSGIKE